MVILCQVLKEQGHNRLTVPSQDQKGHRPYLTQLPISECRSCEFWHLLSTYCVPGKVLDEQGCVVTVPKRDTRERRWSHRWIAALRGERGPR